MALLGDDRAYQDLLGQNASFVSQDINDLDVIDSLTLEYVNPNEVLITDADKKVISTNDLDVNTITLNNGSGSSPAVLIGETADGWRFYKSGASLFISNTSNTNRFFFTETAFKPIGGNKTLGDNSNKWNEIYVNDVKVSESVIIPHDPTSPIFIDNVSKALFFGDPSSAKCGIYSFSPSFLMFMANDEVAFILSSTSLYPQTNKSHNLGFSSNRWNDIYGNSLDLDTNFSCGGNATIGDFLLTNADNTNDIGDATNRWRNVYVGSNLIFRPNQTFIRSGADTQINFYTANQLKLTVGGSFMYPATNNTFDLGASSNRFKTLHLATSIDLNGTNIGTTTWNHLSVINQDLTTTSDVEFNRINFPYNTTATPTLRFGGVNNGISVFNNNNMRFYIGSSFRYIFHTNYIRPASSNNRDLGISTAIWRSLYLGTSIILDGTTIGTTTWNHLSTIDQDLASTDDVQFRDITSTNNISVLNRLLLSYNNPTEYGIQFRFPEKDAIEFVVNDGVYYRMDTSKLYTIQNASLGDSSNKWHDIYSDGFVSTTELRSDDRVDTPTDDAFINVIGKRQFLRTRSSGSVGVNFFNAGLCLSVFDSSNWFIFPVESDDRLKFRYGTALNSSSSAIKVEMTTSGELIAQSQVQAPSIRGNRINAVEQSQFEFYLNQETSYTEDILSTVTWQKFFDLMSETTASNRTNFAAPNVSAQLEYTGITPRKFLVKYKVIARRAGSGVKHFYMVLEHFDKVNAINTQLNQSKSYHRFGSNQTVSFIGEAIVYMKQEDRVSVEVKNTTDSTNLIVNSFSLIAYDLNYSA